VQAGDLGVGDLLPPRTDDPRLVPGYLASDDPAVEVLATELGLGRVRVLSRYGRTEAAGRWHSGEFGPRSDMARSVQKHCGTCGFYTQLAGSLSAIFGACANEVSPADGRVVDAEYGCGAHSELEIEPAPSMLATELAYDDTAFDVEPHLSDSPPVPDIAGSDTSDSCAAQPSGVEGPPASESTGDAAAADPVTRASGDDAGDEDPAQAPSITVSTPPDLLEGQGD
ncbi:MAG: DUF3027 domain-containing protein, partial [Sciscionella sp.]